MNESNGEWAVVGRDGLLQALEAVDAGRTPDDKTSQSSRFVFSAGRVRAFNGELYCRTRTELPQTISCAVHGKPLLEAVRAFPDEEFKVAFSGEHLKLKGKRDTVRIRADAEITMPYKEVPSPGEWVRLKPSFAEGILAVAESSAKKNDAFLLTCVNVTPDYLEATDRFNAASFRVRTGVTERCLIRAQDAKKIASRNPESVSQTGGYLHFKCAGGMTASLRTDGSKFFDLSDRRGLRGEAVEFPKAVAKAVSRLELFSGEYADDNEIEVHLSPNELRMVGRGVSGDATHRRPVKYAGPGMAFTVGPKTLTRLVEDHSEIEVVREGDKLRLVVNSGRLFFYANTGKPKVEVSNGKAG